MSADRPASRFWALSDQEREAAGAAQWAAWHRCMVRAGGIDPDRLSEQVQRIPTWAAERYDSTVDGVLELLAVAHQAGVDTAASRKHNVPNHRCAARVA
jgi:hypothetical protein